MSGVVDAVGYIVVREGAPRGGTRRAGVGARITSATQNPPESLPRGSVAVKIRVRVPAEVFRPELAEATITVPREDVIVPVVEVEPAGGGQR